MDPLEKEIREYINHIKKEQYNICVLRKLIIVLNINHRLNIQNINNISNSMDKAIELDLFLKKNGYGVPSLYKYFRNLF